MPRLQQESQQRRHKIDQHESQKIDHQLVHRRRARRLRMEVPVHQILNHAPCKHDVDERRHQRQQDLKDQNVRQREEPHRPIRPRRRAMLEHRLQNPERPAEPLPHQAACICRSLSECQRTIVVDHPVAIFQQAHRQIGVLGHCVHWIAARLLHRPRPPRSNRPRHHRHHVEQVHRPPLEILARDVFQRLPACPGVDPVAYFGIPRHRPHPPIGKPPYQLRYRIVRDYRICVDPDVDFLLHVIQPVVQRLRLAAVHLGQHQQLPVLDLLRIRLARHIERPVPRPIVDHNHAQVRIIRLQHRSDRSHDHHLLVVSRNQHRHLRLIRSARNLPLPEPVDRREDADQDQPRAHQHVADKENIHDKIREEGEQEERHPVDAGLPAHLRRNRRHHLRRRLAHQLRYGYKFVALRPQRCDQHRQRCHRRRPVPAAIVQQDNAAPHPRMRLHLVDLLQNAVRDLLGRFARVFVPVVRVDLVADDRVPHLLDAVGRRRLVVRVRLLIDRVRRPEIQRLPSRLCRKQPLRPVQLQLQLPRRDFADVRMRERVIADLVPLAHVSLQQSNVLLRLLPDHQEGALHVILLQDVENPRRPDRIGPIVETQRQLVRIVSVLLDRVRPWQPDHPLVNQGEVVRVHQDRALARLRRRYDPQNVPLAFGVHVLARRHRLQQIRRIRRSRPIPYLPQRRILFAQPPQRKGPQPQLPSGTQLVQRRYAIQKPHLVPQMFVLIVVGKVRIQLVAFQMHIRARIGRLLPGVLDRKIGDVHYLAGRLLPLLRQRLRPVEAVIAKTADDLFFRHQFQHAVQIGLEPRLARHRARIAGLFVLVVVHQDDAVARLRQPANRLIICSHLHVHVNPQVLRAEIVVQFRNPLRIQLLVFVRDHFEIKTNSAVSRIRKQKFVQLDVQQVPRRCVVQHLPDHIAVPLLVQRVVIVQHGNDIGLFLRRLDRRFHPVLRVHAMHAARVHHVVEMHREQRRRRHQVAVRRNHVQPVRK